MSLNSNTSFVPPSWLKLDDPIINIHYSKDLIQKRISYSFWERIVKVQKNKSLSPAEKVRAVYLALNDRMMFNTNKQAGFDAESAEQAIVDIL